MLQSAPASGSVPAVSAPPSEGHSAPVTVAAVVVAAVAAVAAVGHTGPAVGSVLGDTRRTVVGPAAVERVRLVAAAEEAVQRQEPERLPEPPRSQ